MSNNKIYLALWSNMWDLHKNFDSAIDLLSWEWIEILEESQRYTSSPMYFEDQDIFLNSVIKCETSLRPNDLLLTCKKIEKKIWRIENFRNGPRLIDIDIILYKDESINQKDLTIPHPRILERDFVLKPLYDIYPEYLYQWKKIPYYLRKLEENHLI